MSEDPPVILVLHPSSTDPTAFLQRLASSSTSKGTNQPQPAESKNDEGNQAGPSSAYSSAAIPWDIENKYYTASVIFRAYPQEVYDVTQAEGAEVVMYLFEGMVISLPPTLIRIMAEPRDIALATRLKPTIADSGSLNTKGTSRRDVIQESQQDGLEDLFDEIGMEYLDESSLPEDDDERQERIRQTLMTHMWSNMVRKPLSTSSGLDLDWDVDGDENDDDVGKADDGTTIPRAEFPVSFHQAQSSTMNEAGDAQGDFPGLDELKSQIMLEDLDLQHRHDSGSGSGRMIDRLGFSRLDMMDDDMDDFGGNGDGGDWVEAEYAKLDDWLEEGEGEEGGDGDDENASAGKEAEIQDDQADSYNSITENDEILEESQFEDDFADFAPFQAAPPPTAKSASLDPTPLLLHLQNVREELAGMDEDTRRVRAGREVESVLQSLGLGGLGGLGGLDWEDDEMEDIDPTIGGSARA